MADPAGNMEIRSSGWKRPNIVARVLADRGMLKRAKDGFQCVEKIQGRPQRVYVLTAAMVTELDHE